MSKEVKLIKQNDVKRAMEKALFSHARELRDAKRYNDDMDLEFDEYDCFEYGLVRAIEMLASDLGIEIKQVRL
jgi:hypothetical protein